MRLFKEQAEKVQTWIRNDRSLRCGEDPHATLLRFRGMRSFEHRPLPFINHPSAKSLWQRGLTYRRQNGGEHDDGDRENGRRANKTPDDVWDVLGGWRSLGRENYFTAALAIEICSKRRCG